MNYESARHRKEDEKKEGRKRPENELGKFFSFSSEFFLISTECRRLAYEVDKFYQTHFTQMLLKINKYSVFSNFRHHVDCRAWQKVNEFESAHVTFLMQFNFSEGNGEPSSSSAASRMKVSRCSNRGKNCIFHYSSNLRMMKMNNFQISLLIEIQYKVNWDGKTFFCNPKSLFRRRHDCEEN